VSEDRPCTSHLFFCTNLNSRLKEGFHSVEDPCATVNGGEDKERFPLVLRFHCFVPRFLGKRDCAHFAVYLTPEDAQEMCKGVKEFIKITRKPKLQENKKP
jgi:hypothetical protein